MSSSFEKSVKGGTKIKLAAPKSKYVEHILIATHAGEAGVAEVFRSLQNRLRDSTWTIVFKSLIIVHLMIREGEPDVTLRYLAASPSRKLAINSFTDVQTQGRNIRTYAEYLHQRAKSYGQTKIDYVRSGEGRLKKLTVEKGLLRETETVQDQIRALIRCDLLVDEPENEITLTAFRLLTMDLLVLFHIMNEGTINVLEHYFEMSRPDAERALGIYRTFVKQTDNVVQYLGLARNYEHMTRLEIPKIKHAPTSLAASLEEYLNDKDFEINRRQYLAQQEAKRAGKKQNGTAKPFAESKSAISKTDDKAFSSTKSTQSPAKEEAKGPAPDLIDFFESIDQRQEPLAQPTTYGQPDAYSQVQTVPFAQDNAFTPQNNAFNSPSTNPFGQPQQQPQLQQEQSNFTGAGFGGYTSQPQSAFDLQQQQTGMPQNGFSSFSQPQQQAGPFVQQPQQAFAGRQDQISPQSTNPFRQSTMPNIATGTPPNFGSSPVTSPVNRQSTNPFAKPTSAPISASPFTLQSPQSTFSSPGPQTSAPFSPTSQPQPPSLQSAQTGTNPFARNAPPTGQAPPPPPPQPPQPQSAPPPQSGLNMNVTGSTNPFRQSAFVNQQTGQGWQTAPQPTMGGFANIETTPVFPRPGQQGQVQQHQTGQGGWG
ncbi:MAG: hypothetical protein M1821_004836 [Bathelium mastoideum]|nr:MAG: hypothetical protein M1821_004836 [Bathelium mastoideum]